MLISLGLIVLDTDTFQANALPLVIVSGKKQKATSGTPSHCHP